MKKSARILPPDFWFFIVTVALVVVGVLLVFDASFARAGDHGLKDIFYFVKRQFIFALIGFGGLFVAMKIHPSKFRRMTNWLLGISFVLLVAVMVPPIGKSIAGAARWIPIGPFHLQPSELAKLAIVMYIADQFAAKGLKVRNLPSLLPHLAVIGVVMGLVLVEPDMGTASCIVFASGVMLYVAGVRKRHLATLVMLGVIAACVLIVMEPYKMARVTTFLHPDKDYYGEGYQITHSLMALSTGGMSGVGLCEGREKSYIPAPETDMIGATLAEETGFVGMVCLLALYGFFTYKGLCIGHKSKSQYMSLLAIGITSVIGVQALMNIAVFTSSMPATGVPLPFISYGGSHLMVMLFAAGMILSISRHQGEVISEPGAEEYENRRNRRGNGRTYISCTEYRPAARKVRRRTPVRRQ